MAMEKKMVPEQFTHNARTRNRIPRLAIAASVVLLATSSGASAQLASTATPAVPLPTTTLDPSGLLVVGNTVFATNSASTQEELPGLGHKFELLGVMIRDTDPENSAGGSGGSGGGVGGNETISATTTPTTLAFAFRNLPPGIKISALTNQLGLKYYFVPPKDCVAGSPRIQLFVDGDGDGQVDFTAHGHVTPTGIPAACLMGQWKYEDLTDVLPRWEVTGASVPGIIPNVYMPWKAFAAAITAALPNHRIRAGMLLDGESCSFTTLGCGKAYYDLLTIENRTLEIWQDTVKN